MKLSNRELTAALRALASANNRARVARDKIMEHCEMVYGVLPGDIDNDAFIDNCDGGAGDCEGMSAAEFDRSMRDCMRHAGLSTPSTADNHKG